MNFKKVKIIGIFIIFILCIFLHYLYDKIPNTLTSIISPVNESIWEHMKLIYTSFIIYGMIEYIIIKNKTKINNFTIQLFLVPIIGIIIYLIIYLPIYHIIGENLFISISLLFITIVFEEFLSYYFLTNNTIKKQFITGLIGIILSYSLFGLLTYYPPETELFFDSQDNTYGIKN